LSWGTWGGLIRTFAVSLGAFYAVVALLPVQSNDLTIQVRGALLANVLLIYLGFRLGRLRAVKGSFTAIAWLLAIEVITLILLPGLSLRETLTLLIGSALLFILVFFIYQLIREGVFTSTLRMLFLIAVILGAVEIAIFSIPNLANAPLLQKVATTSWGGLLVTFFLAAGGILLSFPIGVVLALGRRSSLPVVRVFCTTFIEVVRGVPLVTILFMFSVILQLFMPPEARIDRLIRALMGMTFFSAAYTAENVRGGLQAVSQGQVEAAKSVGLNSFQVMSLIVLPQALRAVIPAIVGQFISLFKDTTLVIIVGINELLGIGKSIINSDPEFIQLQAEVFIFIAIVFWISSYILSYASRQLETALGVGER
jgi:general L-amino acid transport system permease protein